LDVGELIIKGILLLRGVCEDSWWNIYFGKE